MLDVNFRIEANCSVITRCRCAAPPNPTIARLRHPDVTLLEASRTHSRNRLLIMVTGPPPSPHSARRHRDPKRHGMPIHCVTTGHLVLLPQIGP